MDFQGLCADLIKYWQAHDMVFVFGLIEKSSIVVVADVSTQHDGMIICAVVQPTQLFALKRKVNVESMVYGMK